MSRQLKTHAVAWHGALKALPRDDTPSAAWIDAREPRIVTCDPGWCAALGYEAGWLDGRPLAELELAHPFVSSALAWQAHVRNVRQVEFVEWSTWLIMRQGATAPAALRLRVERIDDCEYLAAELLGMVPPVLPDLKDALAAGLDHIPTAACRVARDGSLVSSNATARPFLEFGFDARTGVYVPELPRLFLSEDCEPLAPEDLPWQRAMRNGRAEAGTTLGLARPDGSLSWVLVCVAPEFCAESASSESAVLTLIDVTGSKEASLALQDADRKLRRTISSVSILQDQLARSEHMASLGLMAAGVAHEINNPLSYILSNLSFAAERAIDHESRAALREALEGAGRVRDIVRDLKTLSRMETERNLTAVDPRNCVDTALKLAFDEVRPHAKVQRHFNEVPQVLGDERRLVQILLNLFTNAAQSIAPGAPDDNQISVEVKLADTKTEVEIVVTDTGAGISEAHLPKVFEPFFTTKPAGQGTGLGLSICHRLTHAMGGRIQVSSEEGKGSRFSVFLSAATSPRQPDVPLSEPVHAIPRGRRLLIIDDEMLVARAVRRLFDNEFRIDIAVDGRSALEKLKATEYDVVLCDLVMPDISGLDVYRQVRIENEALARRFIFATGGLFSQELSESVKRLSNKIIEKPFDPEQLHRLIVTATEQITPASPENLLLIRTPE
jgi:signal transduction histidine kinase/ActR/RegA family two-component response regulator